MLYGRLYWRASARLGDGGDGLADALARGLREPAVEPYRHLARLPRAHLAQHSLAQVALRDGDGRRVLVRDLLQSGQAEVLEAVRVRELIREADGEGLVVREVAAEQRHRSERAGRHGCA